ncbi:MAG: hypothetical protein O2954_01105 [bacterium]|nr:hypothetical protein [bacterium]
MKKIALILLLVLGMLLSFCAIVLVMLSLTGVVDSPDGVRELLLGEMPGGESSLLNQGEVIQMQDGLLLLQQQKQELEADLIQLQEDTKTLEEKKIELSGEVTGLTQQNATGNQDEAQKRAERLNQAIALYSAMRPADAASIMDQMSDELVLEILPNLKERQAARILNSLTDDDRKARLSNQLVEGIKKP